MGVLKNHLISKTWVIGLSISSVDSLHLQGFDRFTELFFGLGVKLSSPGYDAMKLIGLGPGLMGPHLYTPKKLRHPPTPQTCCPNHDHDSFRSWSDRGTTTRPGPVTRRRRRSEAPGRSCSLHRHRRCHIPKPCSWRLRCRDPT